MVYNTSIKADRFGKDVRLNAAGIKVVQTMPGSIVSIILSLLVLVYAG